MRAFGKRLDNLEQRKAFQEFLESRAQFEGRSQEELLFFTLNGYWPENRGSELPPKRVHVLYGIRTTIVSEWVDKP
jgi:hypothetical protein